MSLARSIHMVLTTLLVATLLLLQVAPMMSEVSFKGFKSSTNIFRLWLHEDDGDSMKNNVFPLLYSFKLASCYASCNEYFS